MRPAHSRSLRLLTLHRTSGTFARASAFDRTLDHTSTRLDQDSAGTMTHDPLSDLLGAVRLRGAVFYYVSFRSEWAAESPPAREIAEAVMPGSEHVMEYHMVAKGSGWAAI